jgi:Ferritin-like domain
MVHSEGRVEHGGRTGLSRRRLLAGVGAVVATAGIGEHFLRNADAQPAPSKAQDARILQLVLQLEYTQVAFYEQALHEAGLRGELREFAETALDHERQHLAAIHSALGSKAASKPSFDFGQKTKSAHSFQQTAIELEDAAVASYNGQAANLTPATLAAAATIVSVEARHAGWVRAIAGDIAAPRAVDRPLTAVQAAAALHAIGLRP